MIYVFVVCTALWGAVLFILAAYSFTAPDAAQGMYQLSLALLLFKFSEMMLKWHRRHVSTTSERAALPDGADQWKDYAWVLMLSLSVVLSVAWQANQSVAGPDADQNGIRDDVDTLIARSFHASPLQTVYAQRLARLYQRAAVTTNPTHEQAVSYMNEAFLQDGCLSYFLPDDYNLRRSLRDKIYNLTFNTAGRRRNDHALSELIGAGAFTLPKRDECKG